MLNPAQLAALPTVAHVQPGHQHTAVLTFTDHTRSLIRPHASPILCPLPTGGAVFLEDWPGSAAPAYRVPAHLCADLARALDLRRVNA